MAALLLSDAAVFRDPIYDLGMGYSIAANSPGSEGDIAYDSRKDPRHYSHWQSKVIDTQNGEECAIYNLTTEEWSSYADKKLWLEARRRYRAEPPGGVLLGGVSAFRSSGSIVYGRTDNGWFIVNPSLNAIDVFKSETEWVRAIAQLTGQAPAQLRPLNHWLNRDRPVWYYVAMLVLLAGACVGFCRWLARRPGSTPAGSQ